MQDKKQDRRTERTRKAIREAFTSLIIEKEFTEITITELAERANINRKTFYSHYECIEDVLDDLQSTLGERIEEIYRRNNKGPFDIKAFTLTIDEILSEDYNLIRRLVMANEYRFFSRKIKDSLKEAFIAQYRQYSNINENVLNVVAEYCVAGIIKVYKVWFEDETAFTQEELARLVGRLIWGGMTAISEAGL